MKFFLRSLFLLENSCLLSHISGVLERSWHFVELLPWERFLLQIIYLSEVASNVNGCIMWLQNAELVLSCQWLYYVIARQNHYSFYLVDYLSNFKFYFLCFPEPVFFFTANFEQGSYGWIKDSDHHWQTNLARCSCACGC